MEAFEGFSVLVLGDRIMQCMRYVPSMTLTMGNYSVINNLFFIDVQDTNVVMGVQWLYLLVHVAIDWKKLETKFVGPGGKLVVLRGMHSYPLQTVSTHRMEDNLRHGDIAWVVELHILESGK